MFWQNYPYFVTLPWHLLCPEIKSLRFWWFWNPGDSELKGELTWDKSDGPHFEGGADHDKQVTLVLVFGHGCVETVWKPFTKKHNVRLHHSPWHFCNRESDLSIENWKKIFSTVISTLITVKTRNFVYHNLNLDVKSNLPKMLFMFLIHELLLYIE